MNPQARLLWGLFALQAICCAYFTYDMALDIFAPHLENTMADRDWVEWVITLVLLLSLAFTGSELRRTLTRQAQMADQLAVASGAFNSVLQARFDRWALTAAERDVALMALKGYAIAEIAELRQTAQGTVKVQAASVYRKAGVSGRLQLVSLFLEDLMGERLISGDDPEHETPA